MVNGSHICPYREHRAIPSMLALLFLALSLLNGVLGLVACLVLVWHLFDRKFLHLWMYYLIALLFLSPWLYLLYEFVHRSLSRSVI